MRPAGAVLKHEDDSVTSEEIMGRGGMLSEEAHGWERGGDHLGSAASHGCTDTEASTPHHLIVASSFFIEQK